MLGSTLLLLCAHILLLTTTVAAQLRVGNITNVLPQCETACEAYGVMNTQCNAVGVYQITYIYCECTPTNLKIVLDCFNCQSVNATQEQLMQSLLDDIVDTCNDKSFAPDSTLSVSSLDITPSSTSTSAASQQRLIHSPPALRHVGGMALVGLATAVALLAGLL
ncbi:hypothetical protein MKEN_01091700 [Mycena kentingensis (nom. inval.)]|nr:hypothetical protein MKEN_01091700 [Mycena kentingensis (nom. inval.)]